VCEEYLTKANPDFHWTCHDPFWTNVCERKCSIPPSGATIPDKIKAFVNTENPLMYMLSSTKVLVVLMDIWNGCDSVRIYLLGSPVKHVG
jgi:hypothetical protein